jgi:uncharacterized OB-fold protein
MTRGIHPNSFNSFELLRELFEVDEAGRPWLLASRCGRCAELAFPPRRVCPRCKHRATAVERVGEGARLFSFTVCHAAPEGWDAPYLQGYVELPEGIRVFTLISDEIEPRADALEVGMPMEPVLEALPGAEGAVSYRFRPLREQ